MSETDGLTTIVFPPVNTAMEAKIKRLCDTMSDFMDCEIKIKTAIVIVAELPLEQKAAATVLRKIAEAQKKKPLEAATESAK